MKLSEIKSLLPTLTELKIQLPNGGFVPKHFHVTEVGATNKHFIDCGGSVREEKAVNFQLWEANDVDHRLEPQKLANIIALSEKTLGLTDQEIEVEYQAETIGKYGLSFEDGLFTLTNKHTDCLAKDTCGVPENGALETESSCCSPSSGSSCC